MVTRAQIAQLAADRHQRRVPPPPTPELLLAAEAVLRMDPDRPGVARLAQEIIQRLTGLDTHTTPRPPLVRRRNPKRRMR